MNNDAERSSIVKPYGMTTMTRSTALAVLRRVFKRYVRDAIDK